MKIEIIERENALEITGLKDFNLDHIFQCGQCFRWNKEDDESYTGVAYGKVLNIKNEDSKYIFSNTNKKDFKDIWMEYFDLNRDYSEIKKKVSIDETMKKSIEFGNGIRILKQEPWEMLISFIISARNSIPNIKKTIEKLSKAFGTSIGEFNGKEYYRFPTVDEIVGKEEDEVRQYGTSFRTKYILSSALRIKESKGIDHLKEVDTNSAKDVLLEFAGVGPKVSDCILLFGLSKYDVFPVDVWVQRVMDEVYIKGKFKSLDKIRNYGLDLFGEYAGFGQQYLFYYARENGIGKK